MRKLSLNPTPILLMLSIALNLNAQPRSIENDEVSIIFEGNKVFATQQLLEVTNSCLHKNTESRESNEQQRLEYCLSVVNRFMRRQGYLRAVAGEPRIEKTAFGTKITVPIEEGARYRLGVMKIENTTAFQPEQLLQMTTLKKGDIADGDELGAWLFVKVKKLYADKGYIQYSSEIEPIFKSVDEGSGEGTVDFKITVDEGEPFIIRRIEFAGNEQTADNLLRRALVIKEGEPYSEQRLDESLKKINETGFFENIDKGKDVEFRSNDKRHQLDIVIRVKEMINQ